MIPCSGQLILSLYDSTTGVESVNDFAISYTLSKAQFREVENAIDKCSGRGEAVPGQNTLH